MQKGGRDFVDLAEVVREDELTRIVIEVDKVHQGLVQAEQVARSILTLRDEGDEAGRRLALDSLHDYFRAWLQYGTRKELRARVDSP